MSTLKEKALQVQAEKNEKITPEEFSQNLKIFDITGNVMDKRGHWAIDYAPTNYIGDDGTGYYKVTGFLRNAATQSYSDDIHNMIVSLDDTEIGTYLSLNRLRENIGLAPEKIKKGVVILGVTGTVQEGIDTSDANATPDDIMTNKTAYVDGQKITGVYEPVEETNELYLYNEYEHDDGSNTYRDANVFSPTKTDMEEWQGTLGINGIKIKETGNNKITLNTANYEEEGEQYEGYADITIPDFNLSRLFGNLEANYSYILLDLTQNWEEKIKLGETVWGNNNGGHIKEELYVNDVEILEKMGGNISAVYGSVYSGDIGEENRVYSNYFSCQYPDTYNQQYNMYMVYGGQLAMVVNKYIPYKYLETLTTRYLYVPTFLYIDVTDIDFNTDMTFEVKLTSVDGTKTGKITTQAHRTTLTIVARFQYTNRYGVVDTNYYEYQYCNIFDNGQYKIARFKLNSANSHIGTYFESFDLRETYNLEIVETTDENINDFAMSFVNVPTPADKIEASVYEFKTTTSGSDPVWVKI